MKLIGIDSSAALVEWGSPYPVRFGLDPDMSVDVPAFCVPGLMASGRFRLPDGAKDDSIDIRAAIAKAEDHEIDVYLGTKGIHTHYFNAHKHPMSDKAREAGHEDIANELDNMFQQHNRITLRGGRGVLMMVPLEQKRAYALAYYDAEKAGKAPPKPTWQST